MSFDDDENEDFWRDPDGMDLMEDAGEEELLD